MKIKGEEQGVITVEQITELLNNYRIGKKPLAKLLGWGETTILRYVEGDIPTNEYSDKLLTILNNPGYFLEVLTKNKENITTVAYKKCRKAVLKQLLQSKVCVVAQYIINYCNGNISMFELQQYLYYAQSFALALYGEAIFEDDYIITKEECPYIKVQDEFKTRKMDCLELEVDALNQKELQVINAVIETFEWYGTTMFRILNKEERSNMKVSSNSEEYEILDKDTIKKYYLQLVKAYGITKPCEIYKYTDERFRKIKQIL